MKKKLMFKYLDLRYPEIYILEMDFLGDIVQTFDVERQEDWFDNRPINRGKGSWFDQRKEIIETLSSMFSVTKCTADIILNEWVWSRPKYGFVINSDGEKVLTPAESCKTV
jgi:hypothetical protein